MSNPALNLLFNGTLETLYMTVVAGIIALLGGIPLGVLLLTTQKNGILEQVVGYRLLAITINTIRSIPFIILLIAVIPFTRLLVGTSIGTIAAMVPLSIAAIPFMARIVESALREVPDGLIEAGLAMGASPIQIIRNILLPEAMPTMIKGTTIMLISLVGYSAMAGAVGGGGLGSVAINYGYQRFDVTIMITTIVILVILVQCIQFLGDYFANRLTR